ncbi:hypothetical protein BOX15_Mlig006760g2, partial [Macrostomum lignano]
RMSELPSSVSAARPVSDLPAHLQCSSCSKPLFNARQTPHGCRLCQACVTGLLHEVEKRPCPGHTEACTLRDHHSEEDAGGGGSGGEVEVSQATWPGSCPWLLQLLHLLLELLHLLLQLLDAPCPLVQSAQQSPQLRDASEPVSQLLELHGAVSPVRHVDLQLLELLEDAADSPLHVGHLATVGGAGGSCGGWRMNDCKIVKCDSKSQYGSLCMTHHFESKSHQDSAELSLPA